MCHNRCFYHFFGHRHRNAKQFKVRKTCMLTNELDYGHYNENIGFKRGAVSNL